MKTPSFALVTGLLAVSLASSAAAQKARQVVPSPCYGTTYPTLTLVGGAPKDVVAGDLDGDGDVDVAVCEDVNLRIWHRRGRADYELGQVLGVTLASFALGDLDGDGDCDLLTSANPGSTVQVYANDGAGNFVPGAISSAITDPQALELGDLDGDGDLDAVVRSGTSSTLAVLLNAGDGSFSSGAIYAIGPVSVMADMDGDGDLDLATTTGVFANAGDGTFAPYAALTTSTISLTAKDLDGDGDMDLAWVQSGRARVALNLGSGAFSAPVIYGPSQGFHAIDSGDVDGDGDVDLVLVDQARATVLVNPGNGTFQTGGQFAAGYAPLGTLYRPSRVVDLNGDGDLDLLTIVPPDGSVLLLQNHGDGTFGNPDEHVLGSLGADLDLGDVNLDGKPDLVVLTQQGTVLFTNMGGREFQRSTIRAGGCSSESLADVDADGDLDLIVVLGPTSSSTGIQVLRRNANGSYGPPTTIDSRTYYGARVEDLNGDGYPEILASTTTLLSIFENQFGTFGPAVDQTFPRVPTMAFGDMDGDDNLDMIQCLSGDCTLMLGDGTGTFTPAGSFSIPGYLPGYSVGMYVADMDGDADLDLVVVLGFFGSTPDFATLLANDGTGTFQLSSSAPLGQDPTGTTLVDVDRDGLRDIITSCHDSDAVTLVRNLGNGILAPRESFMCHASPQRVVAADFDEDGLVDIAVVNYAGDDADVGRVTILWGHCP